MSNRRTALIAAMRAGTYTAFTDITGFYRPMTPLVIGLSTILLPIGLGWAIVKRMWVPVVWLALATFFGGRLVVIAIPRYNVTHGSHTLSE